MSRQIAVPQISLWKNITLLTDVNSVFIYEIGEKKYFFFGDQHHSKSEGGCEQKRRIKCDDFNYNFTDNEYYGGTCTSIGTLLHNWFTYNNDHGIKTDFYLELAFTKEQERIDSMKYMNIIAGLREQNLKVISRHEFDDVSWMQLISYIAAPCFIREKEACPYYPNVHAHYADIRSIDTGIIAIYADPFLLIDTYEDLPNNIPTNLDEIVELKNNLFIILSIIIFNYKEIIDGILQPDGFEKFLNEYIKLSDGFSQNIGKTYIKKFENMRKISVIRDVVTIDENGNEVVKKVRMHRAAAELMKLREQTPYIANLIEEFIYAKADEYIANVKLDYDNDVDIFARLDDMAEQPRFRNMAKSNLADAVNQVFGVFKKYTYELIPMSALSMDAYLLARMFLQTESKEIIAYAGSKHIEHYSEFFENYLAVEKKVGVPSVPNNRCLEAVNLPKYLDANKYRTYVVKKTYNIK